jgi:ribonuclease BN (tRNA processing enzyme)
MRLTIVGCSGSMSGPASTASSYLVQADDAAGRTWSVLLDLGPGSFGALMNYIDPRALDALFFSHLHPDHMADVTSLQVFLRYHPEGEVGPLRTLGPVETAERIGAVCWLTPEEVSRQFAVERYTPREAVTVGPLRITPIPMNHPVPAFGLRIEGPGADGTVTLAYTGDTDACSEAADLADGVDLLLSEASFQEGREDVRGIHLTGLRAGLLAAGQGDVTDDVDPEPAPGGPASAGDGGAPARTAVGRLVLTHLPPWTDPAVILAEARSAYAGPVEVARAGAVVHL